MPTSAPTQAGVLALGVSDIQMALWVLHTQNSAIPDPGAIDNLWGGNTQAAYLAWTRNVDPAILGSYQNGLVTPMRARDTIAWLSPGAYSVLYQYAMMYRSEGAGLQARTAAAAAAPGTNTVAPGPNLPPPPPVTPLPVAIPGQTSSSNTATWIILGVAVVGAGAFAYVLSRGKKKRRRR